MQPLDPVDGRWAAPGGGAPALVLPDGCVDVIEEEGRLRLVGPMTRARWVRVGPAPVRGVRFKPGAVARWLGLGLVRLTDRVAPTSSLPALQSAHTLDELLDLVTRVRPSDEALHAAQRLREDPAEPVAAVARALSASPRQLHRLFLAELGLPPKVFARIQRLQLLASFLSRPDPGPLADLALACGYTDQPHLNREVRALCGLTPVGLRRALAASQTPA